MRNTQLLVTTFFLFISTIQLSLANPINDHKSIFDIMNYQEVLEVNLEMDIDQVTSDRKNSDKHPAVFSFTDENGKEQVWNINVKLRGKFRRSKCTNMPPLKLNFSKKELINSGYAKFDDLKLVTQCIDDEKLAKELLLKEYLTYKLYNEITVESFRVQLLKINFIDYTTNEINQQWGFVIEDTSQLRNRLGVAKVDAKWNIPENKFDTEQVKTASLFQYMIGNHDWDISAARNVKILKRGDKHIAIPYDFDFCGIVDAPYALVDPTLGLSSQTERIFLGFKKDVNQMKNTSALFDKKQKILFQIVKDFKLLNYSSRKSIIQFLHSFYQTKDKIVVSKKDHYNHSHGE